MANFAIVTGRLTADLELRHTSADIPVVSFTVAVPRRYTGKDKERQADFIDCVSWRKCAEFICGNFHKGKWIEVSGTLNTRTYTDKNGNTRKATELVVENADFVGDKPKEPENPFGMPEGFVPDFSEQPEDEDF